MITPALVINLDRSTDRWDLFSARAAEVGQPVVRVCAVDGNAIPADQRFGLSVAMFKLCHGRIPLPAEYGCYMSHIAALNRFLQMNIPHGVILEDDAGLPDDFVERIAAIVALGPETGVVKLYNHRVSGFIVKEISALGDELGRCIHGPLGSSMGYLVDRASAERLLAGLLPMFLPFDIALERSWRYGNRFRLARRNILVPLSSTLISTLTAPGLNYRSTKLPLPMRTPTAFFRGSEYARRALSVLIGR
ncbi:glycosyl transferase family 25 [Hoeflea marina]|uniref:Glycosyl transferase family 25 n=1 Tax=Hoeflea marina TaxID=274592 RepID=A0A317PNS2_9HYPH|nr:glycosyltransferase family 25 protein [Hoeflea marina]PWW01901.1 glycosyl transferase family 25 [Hoeflea marina]